MKSYWDIFECIFDVLFQNDVISTCPNDHLQHVMEPSIPHLPHFIKNAVVDKVTNKVKNVIDFPPASFVLRYKAKRKTYKKQD